MHVAIILYYGQVIKWGRGGGGEGAQPPCYQSGGTEVKPSPPISPPLMMELGITCTWRDDNHAW